jgi:hypothetical protein
VGWREGVHCGLSCEQSKWQELARHLTHRALDPKGGLERPERTMRRGQRLRQM